MPPNQRHRGLAWRADDRAPKTARPALLCAIEGPGRSACLGDVDRRASVGPLKAEPGADAGPAAPGLALARQTRWVAEVSGVKGARLLEYVHAHDCLWRRRFL
jgi:hypothetical protein